jgi:hypothetical protein
MARARRIAYPGRRVVGYLYYPHFEDCPSAAIGTDNIYMGNISPCCGLDQKLLPPLTMVTHLIFWDKHEVYL